MVKVLAFGTFDKLHPGHLHYLQESAKFGDLYVIIARDITVLNLKGKKPRENEETRLNNIQKLDFVKKVVLGDLEDKYKFIKELKPDVICIGYDQKSFNQNLEEKLKELKINTKIVKFKEGYMIHKYKSSKIR